MTNNRKTTDCGSSAKNCGSARNCSGKSDSTKSCGCPSDKDCSGSSKNSRSSSKDGPGNKEKF